MSHAAFDLANVSQEWKAQAGAAGFALSGICPAVTPSASFQHLQTWLASGFAGEMHYLSERLAAYADPQLVLPGARSILMLALPYPPLHPTESKSHTGRVASYAVGESDYHDIVHERLKGLTAWLKQRVPGCQARGVVDSAPLLERDFARLAGLGWQGKNTLLLNRTYGSSFFLAAILTDLELVFDAPFTADHCGTCTACLQACPTQAFPQPYVLDATRCISYLTIELRSEIPESLRNLLQNWVFGCDVCQDVCPWNRRVPPALEPAFQPLSHLHPLELIPLFEMSDEDFRNLFRRTPLWRTKLSGLLRNAAVVLGNQRSRAALPALEKGLSHENPLVHEACAWAIREIENNTATD